MEAILSFFKIGKKYFKKDQANQEGLKLAQELLNPNSIDVKLRIINSTSIQSVARGYLDRQKIAALKKIKSYKRAKGKLSKRVTEKVKNAEIRWGSFIPFGSLDDGVTVHSYPAYFLDNNSIYKGEFNEKGEKHGQGIEINPDGSKYEGFFKNNKRHGNGRFITAEGDLYQGTFENGKLNGFGILYFYEGLRYQGNFKDGLQHGEGLEESDSWYYKGNYKNGLKHGKGALCTADGEFYDGDFKNNNKEGKGFCIWNDGKEYEGDWKDNKMHGSGIFTWLDGRKYGGTYRNDLMHGFGILNWPDGKVYIGEWKFGQQDGRGKLFYCNIKSIEPWFGTWKCGQRIEQIITKNAKK